MSILPLALFTNRLIYVHSCLIYVHSNLMVSEGISPHSFTDGKLRLEDISPAAYIMEMSATTVFCSQLCLVFSGPELFWLIGPAIQDTAGMSPCLPPPQAHVSSNPQLHTASAIPLCFQAPTDLVSLYRSCLFVPSWRHGGFRGRLLRVHPDPRRMVTSPQATSHR